MRRLIAALLLLAFGLGLAAPPGYMVSPTATGATVVICTSHGAVDFANKGGTDRRGRTDVGGACAFAGHGVAWTPPIPPAAQVMWIRRAEPPRGGPRFDLMAGRGHAAPPPPSQAPPAPFPIS